MKTQFVSTIYILCALCAMELNRFLEEKKKKYFRSETHTGEKNINSKWKIKCEGQNVKYVILVQLSSCSHYHICLQVFALNN